MRAHLLGIAACVAFTAPAYAQDGWSASFNLGSDISLTGEVHGAGTGRVMSLPTSVESRSYGDVYGQPFIWSAEIGYNPWARGEVRGRVFRSTGAAEQVQVGNVGGSPLFAQFNDFEALGVEAGYRQYLMNGTVRPFVGGHVGFMNVDRNSGTFTVPAVGITLPNVVMTDSSTVPTFSFGAGLFVPIGSRFGVQGGVDVRWQGSLEPVEGLVGTGLEPINDDTARWSMPVTVGAVVRF